MLYCIFCKSSTNPSKSVEHIIPKALGNDSHVLPKGWVCDKCNNYLSCKIEKPVLDSEYFRQIRFEMQIMNRRGRIPSSNPVLGIHLETETPIYVHPSEEGVLFSLQDKDDETEFLSSLFNTTQGSIVVPVASPPMMDYNTARFIGMLGLEILAYKSLSFDKGNIEIYNNTGLDELRDYVRYGKRDFIWPIYVRSIYNPHKYFSNKDNPEFQVLHEFDILFVPCENEMKDDSLAYGELYVIIAIFGIEYTINLGGPDLDGYINWLNDNDNRSFLYPEN